MTVWKYELKYVGTCITEMPAGARPLSVGVQNGKLVLWALVDPSQPNEMRNFNVIGTGFRGSVGDNTHVFIGTVQMSDGLVWHVFEAAR